MHPSESLFDNRNNLIALTKKVFDAIVESAEIFPPQLRSMCHCLYQVSPSPIRPSISLHLSVEIFINQFNFVQVLSKRFPNLLQSNIGAVGTVIFLRFINPAIVSPQEYGIVEKKEIPVSVKRGLMLMSKILQNIANHVEFSKEQHMLCFNDFLRANVEAGRR